MRRFIIVLSFLIVHFCLNAQINSLDNYERYWQYRNRLKYFVKVGLEPGESCISSYRNKPYNNVLTEKLHYGDHTVFFGWYIGMLATEFKLLNDNGQNTDKTKYELYCAIESFIRLDKCEDKLPWNDPPAKYDGFFMKDDVPVDFLTINIENSPALNDGLTQGIQNQFGKPSYVSGNTDVSTYPEMSQDQCIHMMLGLALVKKCFTAGVPYTVKDYDGNYICDYYFNQAATTITDKIFKYIYNSDQINGSDLWRIYTPDGNYVDKGSNTGNLGYGFLAAARFITGNTYISENNILYKKAKWYTYQGGYVGAATEIANAIDFIVEGAGDISGYEWPAPIGDISFNYHLISTLAAIGNSWTPSTYDGLINCTIPYNWQPFYILLWKFLHSDEPIVLLQDVSSELELAKEHLDHAPCEGPYNYDINNHASLNWASSCRYRMNLSEQIGNEDHNGNFNGVDYMLMYNLYRLVNGPIVYTDMIDLKSSSEYYPFELPFNNEVIGEEGDGITIKAFETIESDAYIDNYVHDYHSSNYTIPLQQINGELSMRAGKKITLKPGFTAKNGTYFRAYIDPLNCDMSKAEGNGLYAETPMMSVADSIYCVLNYQESNWSDEEYKNDIISEEVANVENIDLNELNTYLFPNPNKGEFKAVITNYNNENITIVITNMLGKVIYNKSNIFNNEISLNISDQPSGIYYIQIAVSNKVFKEKIVIQ